MLENLPDGEWMYRAPKSKLALKMHVYLKACAAADIGWVSREQLFDAMRRATPYSYDEKMVALEEVLHCADVGEVYEDGITMYYGYTFTDEEMEARMRNHEAWLELPDVFEPAPPKLTANMWRARMKMQLAEEQLGNIPKAS